MGRPRAGLGVSMDLLVRDRRSGAARLLDRLDQQPAGRLPGLLTPLASLYSLGARALRRDEVLPAEPPCVGVGNLRVGGTGKTPVVAHLVKELQARGATVGVLTRGHRAESGGDEPQWLRENGALVEVGPDRRAGHQRLNARGVDVILLDDALQSRWRPARCLALGLERDREFVPRCLPAGPAREGADQARARADAWAWRHDGQFPSREAPLRELHFRLQPTSLGFLSTSEVVPLSPPPFQRAVAVSGLARPQGFEADLLSASLPVVGSLRFSDHWNPQRRDVSALQDFVRECRADAVLCPEKNAVRLRALAPQMPVFVVRSRVEWWSMQPLDLLGDWFGL